MSKQTSNSVTTCNCLDSTTWTTGMTSNALKSSNSSNWATISTSSTPTISWGGVDYASGYINFQDNLGSLITYLKETEVENLLDTLIERAVDDTNTVKQIISAVIRSRHFSEDFVLKYFDYVSLPDIRCHHASDINSHSYERLALLIISSHD